LPIAALFFDELARACATRAKMLRQLSAPDVLADASKHLRKANVTLAQLSRPELSLVPRDPQAHESFEHAHRPAPNPKREP
jgi:hypothetical protein